MVMGIASFKDRRVPAAEAGSLRSICEKNAPIIPQISAYFDS
jgi:hypothetical protein